MRVIAANIFNADYVIQVLAEGEQVGATAFHNKLNKDFFDDCLACDCVNLMVINPRTNNLYGEIFLVWGNDGYDVVCDHTQSMSPFMPTGEQMDKYEAMC